MKIFLCINTMAKGGAERVMANLANYLVRNNNVKILTLSGNKTEYMLDNSIKFENISCYENSMGIFNKARRVILKLKKYISILKSDRPDVIVSFLPTSTTYSLIVGRLLKIPIIVSVRNDPKQIYKTKFSKIMMKLFFNFADGFVFQTEDAKSCFGKNIQKKSKIIPNPINETFIVEPYSGEREKKIINVGRLEEQKNQSLLINAFSKLSSKYDEYKLYIYGEGKLRQELQNLINALNIENRVFLAGKTDNLKDKLYKSSLFVLTSSFEGMPNSLMEAMALGVPCISTDCPCGGPKFLIDNGENGYLIPVGDEKKLIEKMEELLSNLEKQAMFSKSANKLCITLNPERINKQWEKYIEDIVKKIGQ